MKTSFKSLVAVLAFGASSLAVQAEPAIKIAFVDIAKAYENHHSLPEQKTKLEAFQNRAKEQFDSLIKEGQAMTEKFKELADQANNPVLTKEKQDEARKQAEAQAQEIQKKEQEVQEFQQQADQALGQQIQNYRRDVIDQIVKAANEVGKKAGATIIMDKSAASAGAGVSIFLYTDEGFDITADVIAAVNKGKTVVAPAAAPAAASPAPAADAPSVSFPGVKK